MRELCLAQMGSGWETAIAYLKLAWETAFETISEATLVLRIKDLVLLASSALGKILLTAVAQSFKALCKFERQLQQKTH